MPTNRRNFLKASAVAAGALGARRRCLASLSGVRGAASRRRPSRRAREGVAQHPDSRRDRLHRSGAGRIRDRAGAQSHPAQSKQDAAGLLQGTRRAVDRRSQRRRDRPQGAQVRRRDRQPHDRARMGAQRGAVPQGKHEALHLHLDDFRLRQRQERVGRRDAIRRIRFPTVSIPTRWTERHSAGTTGRSRRTPSERSRSSIRGSTRSSVPD